MLAPIPAASQNLKSTASTEISGELGLNIALAALGGRILTPVPAKDARWTAINLIDGFPIIRGVGEIKTSFGWKATAAAVPQELIFGFLDDLETTITAVVIDTTAEETLQNARGIPKDIEIHVSTESSTKGFSRIATAVLEPKAMEQIIRFGPSRARYVKLVVASTHGGEAARVGEVQIYEASNVPSIVAGVPKNLALPALGGSLVHFSSQSTTGLAAELIDGKATLESGWSSEAGPKGSAPGPQEVTLAFRDHREVLVDRIVIDPTSGVRFYTGPTPNISTWPKVVEVLISSEDRWDKFERLAEVTIASEPKPITLSVGRQLRYLKFRIPENRGGHRMTLGEIQVIEGMAPRYRSVLLNRSSSAAVAHDFQHAGIEAAARQEQEPNNAIDQAEPLKPGNGVGGSITPVGDQDFFMLSALSTTSRQAVSVDVKGQPTVRTGIGILDQRGLTQYDWNPTHVTGSSVGFTLLVDPGNVVFRLAQPSGAQVIIWDTSTSMLGRTKDLETGLRQYLGQVQSGDRLNLIRFSDRPEVLLPEFTDDSKKLTAALDNKVLPGGATSVYDAVVRGLELLRDVSGNRTIVVMTDGEDTYSRTSITTFWSMIQNEKVRIYSIGLGTGLRSFIAVAGATAERVLANASLATGGRYFFSAESGELPTFFKKIGEELRTPPTYVFSARASNATGTLSVRTVGEQISSIGGPQQIGLILDASGSMKRKTGASSMMDIAREVLAKTVSKLPDEVQVALRVYGHRIREGQPGACTDTQLVVPFSKGNRARVASQINKIKALGTTPIAYSIEAAAADFGSRSGPKMLIVVTDGKEECAGDPVDAAAKLRAKGLDITINVVGFGLTAPEDHAAMLKLATAGGGQYFNAKDASTLQRALDGALALSFEVLDIAGAVVAGGVVGKDTVSVPEGIYAVRVLSAGKSIRAEQVEIVADQLSIVELRKEGSEVGVSTIYRKSPLPMRKSVEGDV